MDSYQRILNTVKGLPVDKVPIHHIGFSSDIASKILGREAYIGGGIQQWREATALWEGEEKHREFLERSHNDAFEIADVLDMDLVRVQYWRMPVKPSKKIDDYTFLYGNEEKYTIRKFIPETELYDVVEAYPPKKELTFEDIEKSIRQREAQLADYDPSEKAFEAVKAAMEKIGLKKAIRVNAGGIEIPLDPIWMEAVLLAPDLVRESLELQVKKVMKDIRYLSTLGVKFIFGGGDFASNAGPMYSPRSFHELMLPAVKRIADACHEEEMFYFYNSDGNLWPVAEDLFGESGVDGYYEIDRRAGMDLDKLRERYPKMTLLGNISSVVLHKGGRSEVIEETMSCIASAKKYGGIVVGCSNQIVIGSPMENVWAMVETLQENR